IESALKLLELEKIDLVIVHLSSQRSIAIDLITMIKTRDHQLPVYFLLGVPQDLMFIENHQPDLAEVEDFFYWNGDSKLFLAIIKQYEDRANIAHDAAVYDLPIILVVETFIPYYSQFLPLLYEQVLQLNQSVIRQEHQDVFKGLYLNTRPRILLVHSFTEAKLMYENYPKSIIGIISNVNYVYRGQTHRDGGIALLQYVRKHDPSLPFLLQSFNPLYRDIVTSNEGDFLYKDLPGLSHELMRWLKSEVGFGPFVFRDFNRDPITEASSLIGFYRSLNDVSDAHLAFNWSHRYIQHWFATHAELALCKAFAGEALDASGQKIRTLITENLESLIAFRRREKIQDFSAEADFGLPLIYKLGDDSIGGKGRGLAFLNVILNRYGSIGAKYPLLQINVPVAVVLATGCFDEFIAHNSALQEVEQWDVYADRDIDGMFLEASLPESMIRQLEQVIVLTDFPLAIRSSSVLEDHITNPFAGVFRTFIIPNSHPDIGLRLSQLMTAVKLVYASMFLEGARVYRESLKIPSREEKMAVIIQKVAGSKHGEYFYPLVSGVAQSYNYYPGTGMQHADGVVTLSAGLGKNAVERGRTFAFCPLYPNKDLFPATEIVKNAQRYFFALKGESAACVISSDEAAHLARVPIDANLLGSEMELISSVWDHINLEFLSGKYIKGPRVITYRNILHYRAFPLAELLNDLLKLAKELLGCEAEMEFAFDVDAAGTACFYLLQIRPISVNKLLYSEPLEGYRKRTDELILYSSYALGSDIHEPPNTLVYLKPGNFDITKTVEIAMELEAINRQFRDIEEKYILIGPGRWGTSDRFLGIPVSWSQITQAAVIVEIVLPDMSIEASHGSHFFHNLFSMNVAYLTVQENQDYVAWEYLDKHATDADLSYFKVAKCKQGIDVLFDGKNAVIKKR
ncbi:MAG TPA: PEP/pyruvate-binding domain-containing protein, partial [Candidatus Cloacimonadota bacterium]|nr:PEP/pyruvate-binding domain-containing protein [Candidatus Cloacimonadota bacterium]